MVKKPNYNISKIEYYVSEFMLLINNLQESTKYILDIFLHILPIRDFPLYMYFGIVYSINEFTDSLISDRLTVSAP